MATYPRGCPVAMTLFLFQKMFFFCFVLFLFLFLFLFFCIIRREKVIIDFFPACTVLFVPCDPRDCINSTDSLIEKFVDVRYKCLL